MKRSFSQLVLLTKRDMVLYFKDKMTFLVSLITPMILLVLFITFLKTAYENEIIAAIAPLTIDGRILDGFSGGWLFSSVLATSCITVSFCSGMMVIDKVSKADLDFRVIPVRQSIVKLAYVFSNFLSTLFVCLALLIIGLIYLAFVGFYLHVADVFLAILNIALTALFGTLLSNIIWTFVNSQGVVSAICTLMSAIYGFICGAYMPISSMGEGFKVFTGFLPGTYSTVFFRNIFLRGNLDVMKESLPVAAVDGIAESFDVTYTFFGRDVSTLAMFLILLGWIVVLFGILILVSSRPLHRKSSGKDGRQGA